MRNLCVLISVLTFFSAFGQTNWLRKAGGLANDEALDVARNSLGELISVGYFNNSVSFSGISLTSTGSSDIFVSKSDANGLPIWVKKFGGMNADRASSIAVGNDGSIYVTGTFINQAQFGNVQLTSQNDSLEIFVTKLDPSGEVIWAKSCGGNGNDLSHGIAVDYTGNVFITGQFRFSASFGLNSINSMIGSDGNATYDVFVAKLNSEGDWQWVRKGAGPDQDRGLSITTDPYGNVFVCGQFTDDIVFEDMHTNTVDNAGFLIKFDNDGNELWFIQLSASQTLCNDVTADEGGNIYLTGDYIGQLMILDESAPDFIPYNFNYNVFLIKVSGDGIVLWATGDGSDSQLASRAISISADGSIYIGGTFRCVFSEMSEELGEGLFNSVGFRDVFLSKFSATGQRVWCRQFGGPGDDFCGGVAAVHNADRPVIVGSFNRMFNVPSVSDFTGNMDLFDHPYFYWGGAAEYCGETGFGQFNSVATTGAADIFFTSPYHPDSQDYDYYLRENGALCDFNSVDPCITAGRPQAITLPYGMSYQSYNLISCPDTIHLCQDGYVSINSGTAYSNYIAPLYEIQWNNGSTSIEQYLALNTFYSVEIQREDFCDSWEHESEVLVHPFPAPPAISDDVIINQNAVYGQVQDIRFCNSGTATLTATDICENCEFYWSSSDIISYDPVITVDSAATYHASVTSEFGCISTNQVKVIFDVPYDMPIIDPQVYFLKNDSTFANTGDTITLCADKKLCAKVVDLNNNGLSPFYHGNWTMFFNDEELFNTEAPYSLCITPATSGYYRYQVVSTMSYANACGSESESYPMVEAEVYVVVIDLPDILAEISGPNLFCPGDSVTLHAIYEGQLNAWSFPGSGNDLNADSIVVTMPGMYNIYVTSVNEYGCGGTISGDHLLEFKPSPVLTSDPAHGIVCPGSFVLLSAPESQHYQWIGPLGNVLDTIQSIEVSIPGFYYCICTDFEGCVLQSSLIEAKEYNSPYLVAFPGTDLCINGAVQLSVQCNDNSLIEWLNPDVGNAQSFVISEPGNYEVQATFCNITELLSIGITSSETPSFISYADSIICPGASVTLAGNPGMQSYVWSPGGLYGENVDISLPGIYTLTTTDDQGCIGVSTPVTISAYAITAPIISGPTQFCTGQSVELFVEADDQIFWTSDLTANDTLSTGSNYLTPPINETTTYYVFSYDSLCTGLPVAYTVSAFASSITPVLQMPDMACVGGDIVLMANQVEDVVYIWSGPVDLSLQNGNTVSLQNLTEQEQGWYSVFISDMNCSSAEDSVYLEVSSPQMQTFQLIGDSIICEGESIVFESLVEADQYNWQTPLGEVTDNSTFMIEAASTANSGWYQLEPEGALCNYESDSVWISVVAAPNFILDTNSVWCVDGYLTVFAPQVCDHYLWSTGDTTSFTIVQDIGWITINATNDPGCAYADSVFIDDLDCLTQMVNIITPNNDGKNEFVDFGMMRIPIEKVYIQNRWGVVIRTLNHPNLIWYGDGSSGQTVADGVYFYSIVPKEISQGTKSKSMDGNIQVITGP